MDLKPGVVSNKRAIPFQFPNQKHLTSSVKVGFIQFDNAFGRIGYYKLIFCRLGALTPQSDIGSSAVLQAREHH